MSTSEVLPVVSRLHGLEATLGGLGAALAQAVPSGRFAEVMASANAALSSAMDPGALPSGSSSAAPSPSSAAAGSPPAPFVPTSVLYGTAAPSLTGGVTPTGPLDAANVVAQAVSYLGVPYQWGGTNPSTGFDCSGFVQRVYGDLGISLPRTSQEQAGSGTPIASLAGAQPGDLVFFDPSSSGPGHVGIYLGNNQMIDAPHAGAAVEIQPVWATPSAIRRILPATDLPSGPPAPMTSSGGAAALGAPPELVPLFDAAGQAYGESPALLAAVAKQESGFSPSAVSSAGAEGLMQLMPATAAEVGVNPFDPAQAIDGAAQLLGSYLHQYGGSVPLALAAYNAGPAAVAQYGGVPPYAQTQQYVASIDSSLGLANP